MSHWQNRSDSLQRSGCIALIPLVLGLDIALALAIYLIARTLW